ncbi:MAG: ABC transporter ATP-binding protein [Phycisphaeraceae bacterium]|nr:ABC transporter ATP-binding protein [Phycisphaeraceae bacterium]
MAKRNDFWVSAKILLRYKRQLAVAFVGVVISSGCFGAGLSLSLPILQLFFRDQQTLPQIVNHYLGDPSRPLWLQQFAANLVPYLPEDPFRGFALTMLVLGVLTLVGSAGRYLHEFFAITVAYRGAMIWRDRLFCRLIYAPVVHTLSFGAADYQSRIVVDCHVLVRSYQAILGRSVTQIAQGAAALGVAFIFSPALSLLAALGAPIIFILLNRFGRVIRRASRRALTEIGRLLGDLKESLGALPVVKAHSAEGYERRGFRRINKAVFREQMGMRRARALASPVVETVTAWGIFGIAVVAAWFVFRSKNPVNPEVLFATVGSLIAAGLSIKPLTTLHNDLKEADAAATRMLEVLRIPVEPIAPEIRNSHAALPRHHHDIRFQTVRFRYPARDHDAPAVDGVDLVVPFGQTTAIVGPNGSGKSTLLSLLPRLLEPQEGRIFIDGVDVATVNLRSLRGQIALVSQQSVIFSGTIADNIAYGRRHESRDRVIAAAQAAFADEFIRQLPLGYDTMLGEEGSGLSGGQRQRLCIARAILRDPAILILDEATSQIDADSEAKISQAIRHFRRGRTTFIIAHRLSTVIDADVILVMDRGRVVAQGTHTQLLESSPLYRNLAQNQLQASAV